MKLGILTELNTISVFTSVVDHSLLYRVGLNILVGNQLICQKTKVDFGQSVHYDMHYTKSKDKQTYHLVSHCKRY